MPGAPALAALAAFRGGAGLVTLAVPEPVCPVVVEICPCATLIPLPVDGDGKLTRKAFFLLASAVEQHDVIAAGPGFSVGPDRREAVALMLGKKTPLVLDADGLNNLAVMEHWYNARQCPLLLTPHPGEFARLTGQAVGTIQADRTETAVGAAKLWSGPNKLSLVVLLKGKGTIVTDGESVYVNPTGNPGMAAGGSGDVLTGLAAALAVQCSSLPEAARLAAWTHGRAGDLAAGALTEVSMFAADLLDYIPTAMKEVIE